MASDLKSKNIDIRVLVEKMANNVILRFNDVCHLVRILLFILYTCIVIDQKPKVK